MLYCGDVPPVSESASAPSQPASVSSPALPSAEDVRALAQLLQDAELSEVAWEDTSGAHTRRVVLRRTLLAAPVAAVSTSEVMDDAYALTGEPLASVMVGAVTVGANGIESVAVQPAATALPALTVASPVVGIFQPAKPPVEVGASVKTGQIVGYVESMRVPNEVRAPSAGVLSALLCLPGQGVEYGQLLFEIAVEPQGVTP